MIDIITEVAQLRQTVSAWKRQGLRVGFVPTMGNLHAGHYSLVALAHQHADRVVSSVFVNPTQFGPNEDFTRYPRTLQADTSGLQHAGCDVLWLPTVESMYPFGVELAAKVQVPGISGTLEGAHRPGHFDGVCTVVTRLFHQVLPDVAVFGRKDYQQWRVIEQMVTDLAFPIEIVAGAIVRETDGLAMSSRNQYLTAQTRPQAATIYRVLQYMRRACLNGTHYVEVEQQGHIELTKAGFEVDYAAVRRADLSEPNVGERPHLALIAARLGATRLIDNLEF